jgi:hypothetical protein
MTDTIPLTERKFLTTRQAADYCGFGVKVRSFYEWARRRGVKQCRGRAVWRRTDLDTAIEGKPDPTAEDFAQIDALVQAHAAQVRGH